MIERAGTASRPESWRSSSDWGFGVSAGANAGVPVVTLAGSVDRKLAGRADPLLVTFEDDGPVAIDVSRVGVVSEALLGLLLRASRRLAWRNHQLIIACRDPETRDRLRIAGLDEPATLAECA